MITALSAALFCSVAAAAVAPPSPPAPVVMPIGITTYTVSTLYTGDRVRDPFLPQSVGGPAHPKGRRDGPTVVDIHALQLRGLMKDAASEFALFSTDGGQALVLRGGSLYDGRNKRVPGITGRIRMKQKRAELITADKDVQIFSLGETDDENAPAKPHAGSERNP